MSMPQPPTRVIYSEDMRRRIRELAEEARAAGILPAFREALGRIDQRLKSGPLPPDESPSAFGEACFHAPFLKILVCQAAIRPIAVSFGVGRPEEGGDGERFIPVYVLSIVLLGPDGPPRHSLS